MNKQKDSKKKKIGRYAYIKIKNDG